MNVWHIRKYKGEWYVWETVEAVQDALNLKDAISHRVSLKELLFHIQRLSNDKHTCEHIITIDCEFDFYGKYIHINEEIQSKS